MNPDSVPKPAPAPPKRQRTAKSLELEGVQIDVASNGYAVYGQDGEVETYHVFATWESLSTWLFNNLAKPLESTGH